MLVMRLMRCRGFSGSVDW